MVAWREFKGSPQNVKLLHLGMIVLLLAGVVMLAMAPVYASK